MINTRQKKKYICCDHCSLRFQNINEIKSHFKDLNITRKHLCDFAGCERSVLGFTEVSSLTRHIKTIHQDEYINRACFLGATPEELKKIKNSILHKFHCKICDSRFTRQDCLDRHHKKNHMNPFSTYNKRLKKFSDPNVYKKKQEKNEIKILLYNPQKYLKSDPNYVHGKKINKNTSDHNNSIDKNCKLSRNILNDQIIQNNQASNFQFLSSTNVRYYDPTNPNFIENERTYNDLSFQHSPSVGYTDVSAESITDRIKEIVRNDYEDLAGEDYNEDESLFADDVPASCSSYSNSPNVVQIPSSNKHYTVMEIINGKNYVKNLENYDHDDNYYHYNSNGQYATINHNLTCQYNLNPIDKYLLIDPYNQNNPFNRQVPYNQTNETQQKYYQSGSYFPSTVNQYQSNCQQQQPHQFYQSYQSYQYHNQNYNRNPHQNQFQNTFNHNETGTSYLVNNHQNRFINHVQNQRYQNTQYQSTQHQNCSYGKYYSSPINQQPVFNVPVATKVLTAPTASVSIVTSSSFDDSGGVVVQSTANDNSNGVSRTPNTNNDLLSKEDQLKLSFILN
ncbi:uncharacterized protein ASCRUDRAFT_81474 [Ascoidea rubescens DSM 1968]|uniref:C2H2-type domain-containing protein n=1 Tax=Ascoidea rubescens DSM 1968 TaxID=1344418 RepID=A0A1D2VG51_9ASCO|nr:hypothetical protein ASCRUDRAFT_81474 [Ascoidea rubescens DSM 1968]ODV60569.1 hypothetical protein ASCRUDRAFT_81474 [Ascoidea rubescens DSM 1968]